MKTQIANGRRRWPLVLGLAALWLLATRPVEAHCDAMDGPVVNAARAALESGDPAPVLPWVTREREEQVGAAFSRTMEARRLGPAARDVADTWFFETIVRLHRAGEGAPFTGLKPAGTDAGPAVRAADEALTSGEIEAAIRMIIDEASSGIRMRFHLAASRMDGAEESTEAGRDFVEAYVDFVHYLVAVHRAAVGGNGHRDAAHAPAGDPVEP